MIKKSVIIFMALLLPFLGFAQDDYVINNVGDTIYGKIRNGVFPFRAKSTLTVSTDRGNQKFRIRDYKAYRKNGKKVMRIVLHSKKGKELVWRGYVIAEGRLTLLKERSVEAESYFLYYNGKFDMIMRRYFPNEVWQELLRCPVFAERYQDYHEETGGRMIVFQRDPAIWLEMAEYYNQNCSKQENGK